MVNSIIDSHAHLDMPQFDHDRDDAIERARKSNLAMIINVGVDLASSRMAISMAEKNNLILAAAGFHPHEVGRLGDTDFLQLQELAHHPRVVAIGEIGLDFFRNLSPRNAQYTAIRRQLDIAANLNLPVVIHARQAENEMVTVLREWVKKYTPPARLNYGVIHCFNGSKNTMLRYIDLGFMISVGAYIGYPTSIRNHDAIRAIPANRLMIETDSPFLPPQDHRGQRNEPSFLPQTLTVLAKIRGEKEDELATTTTRNALRLFLHRHSQTIVQE